MTGRGWRVLRWAVWAAVLVTVATVAVGKRAALEEAIVLMRHARVGWLLSAVLAIGLVYLSRALVYGVPLKLLAYDVPRRFLWETAIVATSLHQLLPAGGATGYAFLTYALHQRGVTMGQASLIALVDTLSYAAAAASLVVVSLVYVSLTGDLHTRTVAVAFVPGAAAVVLAGSLYVLQRDRERFTARVLRLQRWLASRIGARWRLEPVRAFLAEYYEGKAMIVRRRGPFLRMIGYQYLAVCCDCAALYLAFLSLGLAPRLSIVFMGLVVTMAAGAIVSAPAGGGSFELIMSAFFVRHGIGAAEAVAAAVLYRLVAFWVPVAVSAWLLLRFRHRRAQIRRAAAGPARAA
jgi:uncharacterized protein (TIRG00374 family)